MSAAPAKRTYTWQWYDFQGRVIDFEKLMAAQKKAAPRRRRQRKSIRP